MLHWNLLVTSVLCYLNGGKLFRINPDNLVGDYLFNLTLNIWIHRTELEAIPSLTFQYWNIHYKEFYFTGSNLN